VEAERRIRERKQVVGEEDIRSFVYQYRALCLRLKPTMTEWAIRLQSFEFIVKYRKGQCNLVPDTLSRGVEEESQGTIAPSHANSAGELGKYCP